MRAWCKCIRCSVIDAPNYRRCSTIHIRISASIIKTVCESFASLLFLVFVLFFLLEKVDFGILQLKKGTLSRIWSQGFLVFVSRWRLILLLVHQVFQHDSGIASRFTILRETDCIFDVLTALIGSYSARVRTWHERVVIVRISLSCHPLSLLMLLGWRGLIRLCEELRLGHALAVRILLPLLGLPLLWLIRCADSLGRHLVWVLLWSLLWLLRRWSPVYISVCCLIQLAELRLETAVRARALHHILCSKYFLHDFLFVLVSDGRLECILNLSSASSLTGLLRWHSSASFALHFVRRRSRYSRRCCSTPSCDCCSLPDRSQAWPSSLPFIVESAVYRITWGQWRLLDIPGEETWLISFASLTQFATPSVLWWLLWMLLS